MKNKTYKFYSDAGHGWLAVKRSEIYTLGIAEQVSRYSYQKGQTVYLEEDCDATLFIESYNKIYGINPNIMCKSNVERSEIRNYNGYQPD
jgi:hypothetical protein